MTGGTLRKEDGDAGAAFSIAGGGFLHGVFKRLGLAQGDGHDLRRQLIALIGFGWVMFMAVAIVEGLIGPPSALVQDASVHVRLLLGAPLLLIAAAVLDDRCRKALHSALVTQPDAQRAGIVHIIARAERMRGSPWPELTCLAAAMAVSLSLWESTGFMGGSGTVAGEMSATHAWYALVGLPLFQFLLLRTTWLWLVWTWMSVELARLPLELMATHPDLAGGLGYLARPIAGIGVAFGAVSVVGATAWAVEITSGRATLQDLGPPLLLLLLVNSVLALGPSMLFSGQLLRARVKGLQEYGIFAHGYVESFHRRWILRSGQGQELLGTPDLQSLADLGNSVDIVERMRVVPFSPRILRGLAAVTIGPMLPLLLTQMSVREVAGVLGKALIG